MRLLIQRVGRASVEIEGGEAAAIEAGLLVFVGIEEEDGEGDISLLSRKVASLRIFPDSEGVMNLSVKDIEGDVLIVSQFTLHAMVKKGNRPSYIRAARPERAIPLYENFVSAVEMEIGKKVATGRFGADMKVSLLNDGPVTIWMDSKNME